VQPRSGHPAEEKGELWGILNLLQLTADRIKTREIQQVLPLLFGLGQLWATLFSN
jgi:hypothetical protein